MQFKMNSESTGFRCCLIFICLLFLAFFLFPPVLVKQEGSHDHNPAIKDRAQAEMTAALMEQVEGVTNLVAAVINREHTMGLMQQVFSQMALASPTVYRQRAGDLLIQINARLSHLEKVLHCADEYHSDLTNTLAHMQEIPKTFNEVIPRLQQERNTVRVLWEEDEAQNLKLVAAMQQEQATITNRTAQSLK